MFFFLVCIHLNKAAVLQLGTIPNYVSSHKDKELSQHSPIIYSFVAVWSRPEDVRNREIPLNYLFAICLLFFANRSILR